MIPLNKAGYGPAVFQDKLTDVVQPLLLESFLQPLTPSVNSLCVHCRVQTDGRLATPFFEI